ncbi:MAG: LysM peptidoglycan-binding domain-containing protein [Anaerolineae bacterium]|nr:LysM peptidoglycan-binding domain-containing protein [Anaerolineae bacterium]
MRLIARALLLVALFAIALPLPLDAAPPADTPRTHIVQPGDTLFAIALRYQTTVTAIKQLNHLGESDIIQVGQKLLIPASASPTLTTARHIVQADESLYRIALQYGTTVRTLVQLNDLTNPNVIVPGQALVVPTNSNVVKPGVLIEPQIARQGGTLLIRIARAGLTKVTGTFGGKPITFTPSAGYWYALVGISRCAKIGTATLNLTLTDATGQTVAETTTLNIEATAFQVQHLKIPAGKTTLLDSTLQMRENAQFNALVNQFTPTRLWSGVWRQPLYGPVSSAFGTRRSYNGGPVGMCGHEGTDFDVDAGVPIYAPARGRVVFAGTTQVRGELTVIDHGVGVFSAYFHQSAIFVQAGQMVEPGMLIGKVGTTGLSTGPHLHWSVIVNGEYVDPLEWTSRVMP